MLIRHSRRRGWPRPTFRLPSWLARVSVRAHLHLPQSWGPLLGAAVPGAPVWCLALPLLHLGAGCLFRRLASQKDRNELKTNQKALPFQLLGFARDPIPAAPPPWL